MRCHEVEGICDPHDGKTHQLLASRPVAHASLLLEAGFVHFILTIMEHIVPSAQKYTHPHTEPYSGCEASTCIRKCRSRASHPLRMPEIDMIPDMHVPGSCHRLQLDLQPLFYSPCLCQAPCSTRKRGGWHPAYTNKACSSQDKLHTKAPTMPDHVSSYEEHSPFRKMFEMSNFSLMNTDYG